MKVKDLMNPHVIQLHKEDTLFYAMQLFDTCKIDAAPVLDDEEQFVGVVTRSELLSKKVMKLMRQKADLDEHTIELLIDLNAVIVRENDAMADVAQFMIDNQLQTVFVRDREGIVTGKVDTTQMMHFLKNTRSRRRYRQEEDQVVRPFISSDQLLKQKLSGSPNQQGLKVKRYKRSRFG